MSVFLSRPGTSELLHNIDMGVRWRARDTQKPVVKCLFFYIDPAVFCLVVMMCSQKCITPSAIWVEENVGRLKQAGWQTGKLAGLLAGRLASRPAGKPA